MTTGLRGEWNGEKIIRPKVVNLVAERCRLVHIECNNLNPPGPAGRINRGEGTVQMGKFLTPRLMFF